MRHLWLVLALQVISLSSPSSVQGREKVEKTRSGSKSHSHHSSGVKSPPSVIEDSWAYGGGYGYPDMVDPEAGGVVTVRNLGELQTAVTEPGATVYVEDGAEIDLTGTELCLAEGVTLAGGRGRDLEGHSPGEARCD